LDRSTIVGNAALEISRILSDSQNRNDQLHEEENLDDNENEEEIQQLPSIGEFPDIQYILQHSQPIPVTFQPFQQFFTNDTLNVTTLLQIRQSHDAFSRNMSSNLHQVVNRNNNTQEIGGNTINKLITEITADNINENQRRRRRDRWEGRKRLEILSKNNNLGKIMHFYFAL
jgi:hypothetical protein